MSGVEELPILGTHVAGGNAEIIHLIPGGPCSLAKRKFCMAFFYTKNYAFHMPCSLYVDQWLHFSRSGLNALGPTGKHREPKLLF